MKARVSTVYKWAGQGGEGAEKTEDQAQDLIIRVIKF